MIESILPFLNQVLILKNLRLGRKGLGLVGLRGKCMDVIKKVFLNLIIRNAKQSF